MFVALVGASTVLCSKAGNNTELCLQGAPRQVGETDQWAVNAKISPSMVLW